MNFNEASTDVRVGNKLPGRKSNDAVVEVTHPNDVDRAAMDSAQRAQERQHQNENTHSGNSLFTK